MMTHCGTPRMSIKNMNTKRIETMKTYLERPTNLGTVDPHDPYIIGTAVAGSDRPTSADHAWRAVESARDIKAAQKAFRAHYNHEAKRNHSKCTGSDAFVYEFRIFKADLVEWVGPHPQPRNLRGGWGR